MGYSRKLGPPIVSAAVAMLILTNFSTAIVVKRDVASGTELFGAIWPTLLTSAVAIVLVMSFLYRSLVDLVQELERREAAAQHQAVHDPLTGLANRALLEDRLGYAIGRYRRDKDKFALLILDLDRFKQVNDAFGHSAGDLLVQQVSDRLKALIRETDTIARIGGDEFAIIQSSIRSEADVRRLCTRIIETIGQPFYLQDREARVGVSVGAVIADCASTEASELVRKADITMYRAKSADRNCYRLFSEEMDVAVKRRNLIETKLRQALRDGTGLQLHYQPQLDPTGAMVAVEGLLRWNDEEFGDISPAEVVPVAEESGLIASLGEATFRMACRGAAAWPDLLVAVNLSPLQFREDDLPKRLRAIAHEEGVECRQLELEITESLLTEHADVSESAIRELRECGFQIALNDFGTGYSSLTYLRRFALDKLKLGAAFTESTNMERTASILRAAVTLGHALNLKVVAEGISSPDQEQIALEAGCDALQGHRYAPAMSADAIRNFKPLCSPPRQIKAA